MGAPLTLVTDSAPPPTAVKFIFTPATANTTSPSTSVCDSVNAGSVRKSAEWVATSVVSHTTPDGHRTITESTIAAVPSPNATGSAG